MDNIYYVYAYLRNKDSAIAKAGTPYYIGRGKGTRAQNTHKRIPVPKNKINIVIISSNLNYYESRDLEIRLIRWYGRIDINTGILRNKTDGGEGTKGIIVSKSTREKMRKSHLNPSEKTRQKMSAARIRNGGIPHSEETKRKLSKLNIGKKLSKETKDKIQKAAIGIKKPYNKARAAQLGRSHKGKAWWNNGFIEKLTRNCPGKDWMKGRLLKSIKKAIMKSSQNTSGTVWWHTNQEEKRSKECPGPNWTKGRLRKIKLINATFT